MDIEFAILAPMIVAVVLIVTVGGVILLRPLSRQLGDLLEAMARERREVPGIEAEIRRIREALETMEGRMRLVEERQDFTEALLREPETGQQRRLGEGRSEGDPHREAGGS